MIKLYTDTKVLNQKTRPYVFPVLLDLYFFKNSFLSRYYKLVDHIEEADVAVLPLEYGIMKKKYKKKINPFINKAKKFNKTIWTYTGGDFGYTLKDKDIYNFRSGGFKGKLNKNTIILASFISDPYDICLNGDYKPLKKQPIPEIGFVGHAENGFIKYTKEFIIYLLTNFRRLFNFEFADYQSFYPSSIKRAKYLHFLRKSKGIHTNFILRKKYRAGIKNKKERANTINVFYKNVFKNPYTFCIRGRGNFSVRFYETLAVGRIPVLLDTDCLLPLNELINWQDHCIILKESDYRNLAQKIISFHKEILDDEFLKLQNKNRLLWEQYLTRHSFFKKIHNLFQSKLNLNAT